jgi:DNA-binding MarR family transcriptional regulator
MAGKRNLEDDDYRRLLEFRTGLRHFLRWSAREAEKQGLTPTQHQLLLAVRGHDDPRGPTISDVARCLLLRHHSAVELVDRAQAARLLRRVADPDDRRLVRLVLTPTGAKKLEAVTIPTLKQLDEMAPQLRSVGNTWEASTQD